MAQNQDRVTTLHRLLKSATRNEFLFQTVLAELTEEQLTTLELICEKYAKKQRDLTPVVVGHYYREDLDHSFLKRLRRRFKRKLK
ncbi:MAG: hypothetical protein AB1757_24785 [Acidobacteriota bacterium]